jgi:hypothetical protein
MADVYSTFQEVNSYDEPLVIQIQKYIGNHDVKKHIIDETCYTSSEDEPIDDEHEQFLHKKSTTTHHQKIRPDQVWAYAIAKTTTNCDKITNIISMNPLQLRIAVSDRGL